MGFPHRSINTACSDSGQKFEFSSITQAQSEQQTKFQQRKKNFPQLWDGFIQITPGYGNLGLKSPLCQKQLNHTKDNQSSNTRKLGYVPYRQCQYIISLEDKDLYRVD